VFGDDSSNESHHFFAIGAKLFASACNSRQMFQEREEDHCSGQSEKSEAFVEELHEAFELRIFVVETLGHDHGADDVRDGAVDEGSGVDGDAIVFAVKNVEKVEDFGLN
jgi:hypothetical protein